MTVFYHISFRLLITTGFLLLGVSCSSRPGGYSGYMTGSYTVRGQTYHPLTVDQAIGYSETGECSWYNESTFFGLRRGNSSLGEKVMPWHLTGAHKTLPLPALVKVTNLENGKSVKVRINDRGPFIPGRHLDVTPRVAKKLQFYEKGLTRTKIEVLSIGDGKYRKKSKRRFLFW